MANYQPSHNFTLDHSGDNNNTGVQSAGASHPAYHAQGAMDNTPAHLLPHQIAVAREAGVATGASWVPSWRGPHARINFDPAHTCATCKAACPNNHALEKHAAKERHKAFLCACSQKFVRLATLNRHIAAQAGPKHHCLYCDGNKGFAREDKLIDHLRASHKFGESAIVQFRSQARAQPDGNGHASPFIEATGNFLPIATSAGYNTAPGDLVSQAGYVAGPAPGRVDSGVGDFPMFSGSYIQPFGSVKHYPLFDAANDSAGYDFSGIDFTVVDFTVFDGDLDMSGMDNMM